MNNWGKSRLLRLRKIDAAKRQIESAIWLWFVDADIVSVHTLTLAAHRILLQLSKTWGVNPLPLTTRCFPRRHDSITRSVIEQPDAFFKQAKSDEIYEL